MADREAPWTLADCVVRRDEHRAGRVVRHLPSGSEVFVAESAIEREYRRSRAASPGSRQAQRKAIAVMLAWLERKGGG
jgi:hypothetical protein